MVTRSIYLVLVSLLQLVQLSFTRFVFQFELHAIDTNGDCSSFFEVSPECETYLHRFCLREAGSSRANTDDSDCPLGASEPRVYADDTLPVTRVTFSEQSWPEEFQMFIRAYDEEPGFQIDDFLDNIFIEMQLGESDNFTAIKQFTGEMNKVSVNMSFRVSMCPDNLYGVNCDIMCISQNDDLNGHYTCNDDGSIQCRPGFHNVSNNCRDVDPCTPTPCANNGNCTIIGPLNFTCECAPGYTGSTCDDEIDGCLSVTCPSNSVCVNGSGECVCLPGFQLNGGMCVELSMGVSDQAVAIEVIIGVALSAALIVGILIVVIIVVLSVLVIKGRKPHRDHQCTCQATDRDIKTKPNEVYGLISGHDRTSSIEMKPNEVYGFTS